MKITDTTRTSKTGKTNKAKNKAPTNGPSFTDMLHNAQQANAPTNDTVNPDASSSNTYAPLINENNIPSDPQERAAYLLDHLRQLEADILSGAPTNALNKLREALAAGEVDKSSLAPELQQLLDEIDLRAQVEIAKRSQ